MEHVVHIQQIVPINEPVIGQGVIEDLSWSEGPMSSVIL